MDEDRLLVGLRYAPNEYSALAFAVGHSTIPGDGTTLWRARGDMMFSDSVSATLGFEHDRQSASPRALSLGITRNSGELQLHFTPDLNWTGDAWLHKDNYSDGNNRSDVILALRRAAVRKPKLILDLGGIVEHMHYDERTLNGYYAPDNYRRYGATARTDAAARMSSFERRLGPRANTAPRRPGAARPATCTRRDRRSWSAARWRASVAPTSAG